MSLHIRLYKDSGATTVFRDIVAYGVTLTRVDAADTTKTINGVKYHYRARNTVFINPSTLPIGVAQPAFRPKSVLPDSGYKFVYLKNGGRLQIRELLQSCSVNSIYMGSNAVYTSFDINAGAGAGIYFFTTIYQGVEYVVMFPATDPLTSSSYVSTNAVMISTNYFEGSLTPKYGEDSDATPDGGYGTYDNTSDNVGNSSKPVVSMPLGAGYHGYVITPATYNRISSQLWGVDQNYFKALWSKFQNFKFNPIAGIINCVRIPKQLMPTAAGTTRIQLAGTVLSSSTTGITIQDALSDYTVTFPSSWFAEYYGSFMDYTQDTQIILHVPFCGTMEIPPYVVIGGGLSVNFRCDVFSGNVCAIILTTDRNGNSCAIASMTGNCAYPVPFSGNDNGMGDKLQALQQYYSGAIGGAGGVLSGDVGAAASGIDKMLGAGYTAVLARHSTFTAGQHGGSVAICTNLNCYVEIRRSAASQPAYYDALRGRPSDIGTTVSSFSGYTVFSEFHADIAGATAEEKAEIESLMREGVII